VALFYAFTIPTNLCNYFGLLKDKPSPKQTNIRIPTPQKDLEEVSSIHLSINGVYYTRIGSIDKAYTRSPEMEAWPSKQGPDRLATCLKALAVLGQPKAYLHWSRVPKTESPSKTPNSLLQEQIP
jgi:hypothetical protein